MSNETAGCLSLILTIIFVLGAYACFEYSACHNKAEKQGFKCEWGPLQGCMVKTDNGWMDYERLRYVKE